MSRIFDALLRSESERSGVEVSALSGATQLLEQAEKHAASESAVSRGSAGHADVPDVDRANGVTTLRTAVDADPSLTARNFLAGQRQEEFLRRIQTITGSPDLSARLVSLGEQDAPAAEAFRFLGVRLRHMRRDRALSKLLITSTIPQEGKTLIASNIACTLSLRSQQRVLVLEGDLRRPALTELFALRGKPGVYEWLRDQRKFEECIYQFANPPLWVMPGGNCSGDYLELLQSGKIVSLLDELSEIFDWIIIDSPPVLPLADASVWSRVADGILLVTRRGRTEKKQLQKGLEAIESQKLIGAVMNSSSTPAHGDYYYTERKSSSSPS